ncbi:tyrosine-type recombinase/integrase [Paraburkholderia sp. SIMBA_055]
MKLSVKQLEALRPENAGTTLRETGGLVGHVRATRLGMAATFYFEFKFDGSKHRLPCGSWPRTTLANIRRNRDEARALLDTGVNPVDARKAERLENQVAVETRVGTAEAVLRRKTFRERFVEWEASALKKRKDNGAEIRRAFDKDVLPLLGDMAMEDVKRSHLMPVLDAITARGANRLANRTLTDLKQFFKWCQLREHIAIDPLLAVVKKDVGGSEVERERTLSSEEIRALPAALESADLIKSTRHALMLILATNARVGEVIKARKSDINLNLAIWRIPVSNAKNRDSHVVFLSEFALEHMRSLLALSSSEEWLLPAQQRESRPETHVGLKTITKQVADRQLKFYERKVHTKRTKHQNALVLGDEKWTPHDLRRTAATLMQELGVLPVVVEKCMNHREQNRITRIYQRYPYSAEKREAWHLLGQRLELLTQQDSQQEPADKHAETQDSGETPHRKSEFGVLEMELPDVSKFANIVT